MERLLLTVTQAADLTGIGRNKAYELVANGTWPRVVIGRSVRVPREGLEEWVRQATQVQEPNRDG